MLLEMLFAISCKDAGNQMACEKAFEASTKQSYIYDSWSYAEDKVKSTVTAVTGKEPWVVLFTGYKVYKDKAVAYSFKPGSIADKLTAKTSYDRSGSLNLEWKF